MSRTEKTGQVTDRPVVISILTLNNLPLLKQCIDSIKANTAVPHRICVVDQGTTDGTAGYLAGLGDGIDVITSPENLGFVLGNNRVMERYPDRDIVLLNDDTIVKRNWLRALRACAYEGAHTGIVGAKLVYPDGRLQEAGGEIFRDGSGRNIGKNDDSDRYIYNVRKDVDYCSGACLYIKREVLDKVGYLDPIFSPAYWEDTDLCFRARKAGYRVVYEPAAEVIHFEGTTAGSPNRKSLSQQLQARNKPRFMARWGEELKRHRRNVFEIRNGSGKDKILIVMPFLPMYDRAAGEKRWFHTLKILRDHFDIAFLARNGLGQVKYVNALEEMGITVFHTDQSRLKQMGINAAGPVWIDFPLLLQSNDFKAVIVGFYHMAHQYWRDIRTYSPESLFIIDSFDVSYVRQRRKADLSGDPSEIWQALETKRLELSMYRKADMVLTVTEQDRQRLLADAPDLRIGISTDVHPIIDDVIATERSDVVFVGNYNHDPNVDAVLYFVDSIWPRIKERLPEARFYIVGNAPTTEIEALASDDVTVTGFVPEVTPYLLRSKVFAVPLRYGAGLKGKIGEALASGIPIVTTTVGAEGMGLIHRKNAMLADDPDEFARCVAEVYTDPDLWQQLAQDGKEHARCNYSYEAVGRYWREVIAAIRRGRQTTPQPFADRAAVDRAGFKLIESAPELVPKVSIVIPVHDNLELTQTCWTSIRKNTTVPHEVVIIDNGSSQDVAYDADQNNLRVIRNDRNMGFAYACNQGIQATHGDYVVILNNDTIVTPGWLQRLLWHTERDETVGIVGPSTSYASTVQQVECDYRTENDLYRLSEGIYDTNRHKAVELDKVVGVCMLMRRSMLEAIGLFDTRFGLGNYEDDDICLRARIGGYKVLWAKDVFVHHKGSQTFERLQVDYPKLMDENRRKFIAKWTPVAAHLGLRGSDEARPEAAANCRPVLVVAGGTDLGPRALESVIACSDGSCVHVLGYSGPDIQKPGVNFIPDGSDRPLSETVGDLLRDYAGDTVFLVSRSAVVTPGWMKPLEKALLGDNVGCVLSSSNAGWGSQRLEPAYRRTGKPLIKFAKRNALMRRGRIERVSMARPSAIAIKTDMLLNHGLPDGFESDATLLELERQVAEAGMGIVCAMDSYVHIDEPRSGPWDSERKAVLNVACVPDDLKSNQVEAALRHLDEAIELKPDYVAALYERGMLRAMAGMTTQAIDDFKEVARLKPGDSKAYNNLGCLEFSEGRVEDAEASFQKAVDAGDGNWEAKKNLADLYLQTGRAEEAMNLYSLIMDEHPKCPEVYVSLGRVFAGCGDIATGEQCFRLALQLAPDNEDAKQGLGAIDLAKARLDGPEVTEVESQEPC